MELTDLTNEDLVDLAVACPGQDQEAAGLVHDESACLACQAWAVYETRGAPRLS